MIDRLPVGQIRFDRKKNFYYIDYSIDKTFRNFGLGKLIIKESIKKYKKHRSFSVREPEIDFLDRDLLFNKLDFIWKKTDIIIHSGAFVGTDFCQQDQQAANAHPLERPGG